MYTILFTLLYTCMCNVEIDISVLKLLGFKTFANFFRVSVSVSENLVSKKVSILVSKNLVSKKLLVSENLVSKKVLVSENLVSEKSLGFGFGEFGLGKSLGHISQV